MLAVLREMLSNRFFQIDKKNRFTLSLSYNSLYVEERVENLAYDIGSFLVSQYCRPMLCKCAGCKFLVITFLEL